MIPILFEYNETDFTTHGIGDLIDCESCVCGCNDEGEFELSFVYPKESELFNELTIGRQILAKANTWQQNQIFRIYGYEKELGGKITVNCEHISYDLNRIPIKKFKANPEDTQNTVLQRMKGAAMPIIGLDISRFTFYSDVLGTAQTQDGYFELETPSSARAAILDGDDSIKGTFGGNLVFDRYDVKLLAPGTEEGGMDRGVLIEYGVDLIDLQQEENISEMYTGVFPFYRYTPTDSEDEVCIYGSIQYANGTFQSHKIAPLDVTEYFPNQEEGSLPTAEQINAKAVEWMAAEDGFGEPEINLTLSYAKLGQDVRLHDQVTVRFVKMGLDYASKVTSYKYDVLSERMTEVQVGRTKKSILFSLEDASRLKKGLLPPKRIKSKSITSDKYADGSVGSAAIGSGAVGTGQLADLAVDWDKIADGAVDGDKIADNSITYYKIEDGAIIESKIASGAVTGSKVLDAAIEYSKLAADVKAVFADLIAADAFFGGFFKADGSVSCNWLSTNNFSLNGTIYVDKEITTVVSVSDNIGVGYSTGTDWTSRQEEHRHQYTEITGAWITGGVSYTTGKPHVLGPSAYN